MKLFAIFIFALFSAIHTAASLDFYHLAEGGEPKYLVPPFINGYDDLEYKSVLYEQLLQKWGRGQLGTMLAIPDFVGEEYCVSIYEKETSDSRDYSKNVKPKRFIATAAVASRNLYYWSQEKKRDDQVPEVEITHNTRTVSRDLAVAFQRVWARAILQTRYPTKIPPSISHGIRYRFSVVLDIGEISGEAANPQEAIAAEMARIGRTLYELVMGADTDTENKEASLIERLRKLEERMN